MKGKKEFAILFFIIAVLAFYIFSEKGEKTHYSLPAVEKIVTGDISKVSVKKKDAEINLEKVDDKWRVGAENFPADNSQVEKMLEEITGLTLTVLASETGEYAIYELDEKNRIEVEVYKGDSRLRKVVIGKPASSYRHTFVMLDDDNRVFHAAGNFRAVFDKGVSDIRDKKVMVFHDEITEVTLKKNKEKITVVKTSVPVPADVTKKQEEGQEPEEAAPTWTTTDGKPAKKEEVDGLISALSDLLCDNFIEDRQKEDFTLPIYTATLKGTKIYSISLFEKRDNQYPAVSSESDYPFLISEWKAKQIMKDLKGLLEEKM